MREFPTVPTDLSRFSVPGHTHDCTGPDSTCPCGYVFRVPPISFSVTVHDGRTEVLSQHFNCETLSPVIEELRRAADSLQRQLFYTTSAQTHGADILDVVEEIRRQVDVSPQRKFPPIRLQDGLSTEWTCQNCGGDCLFCGCAHKTDAHPVGRG